MTIARGSLLMAVPFVLFLSGGASAQQWSCTESRQDCRTNPAYAHATEKMCEASFKNCMRTGHWIGGHSHADFGERRKE
jgi:hypothetical protein